jgi:hypothetical protein
VVECDATVVDHFGRSGACGAVSRKSRRIILVVVLRWPPGRPEGVALTPTVR